MDTTTFRRGTTVMVIAGPQAGTIGKVTGGTAALVYIEATNGWSRYLVTAPHGDVAKAPHPASWYDQVRPMHSCEGCSELDALMAPRRSCHRAMTTRDCPFSHDWTDGVAYGKSDHVVTL